MASVVQIDNPGHSIRRIGRDCFEGAAEVHVERFGTTCEDDDPAGPCGVMQNEARWFNLTDGLVHPIQRFTRTSELPNGGFWKVNCSILSARNSCLRQQHTAMCTTITARLALVPRPRSYCTALKKQLTLDVMTDMAVPQPSVSSRAR